MTFQDYSGSDVLSVAESAHYNDNRGWRIDKHIPVALLIAILIQTCGAIWWAASISGRVSTLEQQNAALIPLTAAVAKVETSIIDMKEDLKDVKALLRSPPAAR